MQISHFKIRMHKNELDIDIVIQYAEVISNKNKITFIALKQLTMTLSIWGFHKFC